MTNKNKNKIVQRHLSMISAKLKALPQTWSKVDYNLKNVCEEVGINNIF